MNISNGASSSAQRDDGSEYVGSGGTGTGTGTGTGRSARNLPKSSLGSSGGAGSGSVRASLGISPTSLDDDMQIDMVRDSDSSCIAGIAVIGCQ